MKKITNGLKLGNIYWRDITPKDTVIETKTGYLVIKKDGTELVPYWHGEEAGTAQSWLKNQTIIRKPLKKGSK